jgi:arsenite-transporting ATPase
MEQTTGRRLYIFTGKGGVGKTTLAKAFVRHLLDQKINAIYLTFQSQALGDVHTGTLDKNADGIREVYLDLDESARGYIEKRLNSKLIAAWVVKTPFFRALVNMMPGFSYLIFLGKILQMQMDDKSLVVVLDAPASGHALTMVEATTNFRNIFRAGIVYEDTNRMLSFLNDPKFTKIHVVTLPGLMSWQEATELKAALNERTPVGVDITVNNCLYLLLDKDLVDLPVGLREKTLNEERLIKEHISEMHCVLPHSLGNDSLSIQSDLVGSLSKLI